MTVEWVRQAGGIVGYGVVEQPDQGDIGGAICDDGAGGAFVAGMFGSYDPRFPMAAAFGPFNLTSDYTSIFVMRVDAAGDILWAKRIGEEGDYGGARAIVSDGATGAFFAGWFGKHPITVASQLHLDAVNLTTRGQWDAFVAHIDADGKVDWAVSAGGAGRDSATAIARDGMGGVFVCGDYDDKAYFGPSYVRGGGIPHACQRGDGEYHVGPCVGENGRKCREGRRVRWIRLGGGGWLLPWSFGGVLLQRLGRRTENRDEIAARSGVALRE